MDKMRISKMVSAARRRYVRALDKGTAAYFADYQNRYGGKLGDHSSTYDLNRARAQAVIDAIATSTGNAPMKSEKVAIEVAGLFSPAFSWKVRRDSCQHARKSLADELNLIGRPVSDSTRSSMQRAEIDYALVCAANQMLADKTPEPARSLECRARQFWHYDLFGIVPAYGELRNAANIDRYINDVLAQERLPSIAIITSSDVGDLEDDIEREFGISDVRLALRTEIDRLPSRMRTVVMMRLRDVKFCDIASAMGTRIDTAQATHATALKRLAKELRKEI